ncbi:unnamed protein product [Rotaria sordida]|uniref:Apple domain-containing protein n=1 Tax=Rotaria sordida TaxID=392033 RepID=A0A815INN4_9BILA|nr:unnamed protein product [Rotaria sordida]CAF1368291.1 unnamed protein product [Rotaria sordida]CAF4036393.1 unnamed protein product [Rotaria sordida]
MKVSPALCPGICAQTQQCTHYTWSNWDGGTCWMKMGDVSRDDAFFTGDPTMVCGIVNGTKPGIMNFSIIWNESNWAMSCDFHGNDLIHYVPISSDRCPEICAQTQECTHYSWTNLNGGTCWMKKGKISRDDAFFTNDPLMFCGIITRVKRRHLKRF